MSTKHEKHADVPKDDDAKAAGEAAGAGSDTGINELASLLEKKTGEYEEVYASFQRIMAEFDNYKKRTAKEKNTLYRDAVCDVISSFLPVIDNIERAVSVCGDSCGADIAKVREGMEMISKQFMEIMKNFGLQGIKCVGEKFDPNLHNAVMHVEDDGVGDGIVVEEFQKGYALEDKVIRPSMVKVAN